MKNREFLKEIALWDGLENTKIYSQSSNHSYIINLILKVAIKDTRTLILSQF